MNALEFIYELGVRVSGTSSSGGRPKPTALKLLQGNPGHKKLNDSEPKFSPGMPEMPKGLPRAARRLFKRWGQNLMEHGVLTVNDGVALAEACRAQATVEALQKEVDKRGHIIETPIVVHHRNADSEVVGYKVEANPALSKMYEAQKVLKTFIIEFGLTPSSRSKLHVEKKAEVDPVEEILSRPSSHHGTVVVQDKKDFLN